MKARKPFVYLAAISVILAIIGLAMFGQQFSGRVVQNSEDIDLAEVIIHSSPRDCWIISNNEVYDVTIQIHSYPELSFLIEFCGKDASAATRDLVGELKAAIEINKLGKIN